jgi:hypothetical protein
MLRLDSSWNAASSNNAPSTGRYLTAPVLASIMATEPSFNSGTNAMFVLCEILRIVANRILNAFSCCNFLFVSFFSPYKHHIMNDHRGAPAARSAAAYPASGNLRVGLDRKVFASTPLNSKTPEPFCGRNATRSEKMAGIRGKGYCDHVRYWTSGIHVFSVRSATHQGT